MFWLMKSLACLSSESRWKKFILFISTARRQRPMPEKTSIPTKKFVTHQGCPTQKPESRVYMPLDWEERTSVVGVAREHPARSRT